MANKESLNQTMGKAVTHYASLFWLPSYRKIVVFIALICIVSSLPSAMLFLSLSDGITMGLLLGISLFLGTMIGDYLVKTMVLKRDPIYNLRRTAALSLYCWSVWLFFVFLGVITAPFFGLTWLTRLWLLGFSAALTLRFIVFGASASANSQRIVLAAAIEPFLCISLFLLILAKMDYTLVLFLVASFFVTSLSSLFFLSLLNRVGKRTLGVASLSLFRAFFVNWVVNLNAPFEEFLEKLGENQDIEVSLVKFSSSKPKAMIIVPSVHPGPFKNIGSSLLPSLLKGTVEQQEGCITSVPLGVLGHEVDLASQSQNQKILDHVAKSADFKTVDAKASPFLKFDNGLATVCCQVFGDFAFLSFSLAPKTTEDLPQELGVFVRQEAEKHGLNCCIAVNAHNSIDGSVDTHEILESLKSAASICLEKAVTLKRLPFEVGAATVLPKEFTLKDGMGAGGITVTTFKVGEQKAAYVIIDGNNMVAGLREKILSALQEIGIAEGEVFTTDTHSVNALVLGRRGYHPVGEAMDHAVLIRRIKETSLSAMSNMEQVTTACHKMKIHDVRVIGEKSLEKLCLLIDRTIQTAKKVSIPIFATSGVLLMLILMFV